MLYESLRRSIGTAITRAVNEAAGTETLRDRVLKKCDRRKTQEIADEIIKLIDADARKRKNEGIVVVDFRCGNCGYGERPFGSGHEERERRGECMTTDTIEVCGKRYELTSSAGVIYQLIRHFDAHKDEYFYDSYETGNWGNYRTVLQAVGKIVKTCREFSSLRTYLSKYAGYDLLPSKCYSVRESGKRGQYSENLSSRRYACCDGERCARFLEQLRKLRSTNDKLKVEDYTERDREDQRYSEYYETECSGSSRYCIKVTVSSPSGKVKGVVVL